MSIHLTRRRSTAILPLLLLVSALALAACGSSSSNTSSAKSAAATGPTSAGQGPGQGAGRFAAVRACLQKNGITLPQRSPGQGSPPTGRPTGPGAGLPGGHFLRRGTPQLPKGVTPAQYEAALKKCGGLIRLGAPRFNSPAFKQALAKFASCLRQNGVKLPAPNTSGNGPVFNTKGINTSSTTFKTAEAKCRSDLNGAFPGRPGGGGPQGTSSPGTTQPG